MCIRDRLKGYGSNSSTSSFHVVNNDSTSMVYIRDDGNVGIGTTTPQNTLNVIGDANVTGTLYADTLDVSNQNVNNLWVSNNATIAKNLSVDTDTLFLDAESDRVGIGTASPGAKLDVAGDVNIDGEIGFRGISNLKIKSTDSTITLQTLGVNTIVASGTTSTIRNPDIGNTIRISGTYIVDSSRNLLNIGSITASGDLAINTDNLFVNTSTGDVGIGTTTPQNKLNVIGDINATTGITIPNDQTIKFGGDDFIVWDEAEDSISIGKSAGEGDKGVFIGKYAGYGNEGLYVSALGYQAARENEGNTTTAFGYNAGYQNTANYITAIGYGSLYQNSGSKSVGIGFETGKLNSGSSQTAIGPHTGYNNSGNYQIAIGYKAGISNTGDYQTALGYYAGHNNTGDNVVAIGYEAGKDNTDSNQFILKQANINAVPLIQGNFSSGNVGIGTDSPQKLLHLDRSAGNVQLRLERSTSQTGVYDIGSNDNGLNFWANAYDNKTGAEVTFALNGNVGIGTSTPQNTLNVIGDGNFTGNITGNQIYGEMWYHNHTATEMNFASSDTWYPLFFTNDGLVNGFAYSGGFMESSNLTAQVSGKYKVTYMASGDGQNNHQYFTTILINSVAQEKCSSHKKMSAGGDIITMTGSCIVTINAGDDVQLATMDYDSTGTGNYFGANLNLVRIGN